MSDARNFDVGQAIEDMQRNRKLALTVIGFVAVLVGLFLPWYEANVFGVRISSSPGLDSTGLLVAIAAIVGGGAALNVLNKEVNQMRNVAIGAAALAALIILANYPDNDLGSLVRVSLGYWVSVAGAAAALVGSLTNKRGRQPDVAA